VSYSSPRIRRSGDFVHREGHAGNPFDYNTNFPSSLAFDFFSSHEQRVLEEENFVFNGHRGKLICFPFFFFQYFAHL